MKLKLLTAITAVCISLVACDNKPSGDSEQSGKQAKESENTVKEQTNQPNQRNQQGNQQRVNPNISSDSATVSTDYTDEELEQLADLSTTFQQMSQSSQSEMMKAVENAGLKVDRYTEIQQSQQNPSSKVEVTDEEMKKFQDANKALAKINEDMQARMVQKLDDAGLSEQWYQNITMALRQDQQLLAKYQQILQKRMPQQNQPPIQ